MDRILTTISVTIVALYGSLLVLPANAGEWKKLQRDENAWEQCSHEFAGKIRRGDLTEFLNHEDRTEDPIRRVCLNSPGGSLSEVLDVAREERLMGTRVRTGDECSSACAILFMMGLWHGANSLVPDRLLDPGAKLGFHSPFIGGRAARVGAENAFKVAIDISKLLADRSYKTITTDGPTVQPELLALMLGTPSDQMHYVNRIGEIQILNIEKNWSKEKDIRIRNQRKEIIETMKRICVTSYALTFPRSLVKDGYAFDDLAEWVKTTLKEKQDWDKIAVEKLQNIPVDGDFPGRYEGLMTGPFSHPHWNGLGGKMYCQPTLAYQPSGNDIRVTDYYVDFDLIFSQDNLSNIPAPTQVYREVTAGLIPFDSLYE